MGDLKYGEGEDMGTEDICSGGPARMGFVWVPNRATIEEWRRMEEDGGGESE